MEFWTLFWSYVMNVLFGPLVWNSKELDHRRELQWWNPFAWLLIIFLLWKFRGFIISLF